MKFLFFLLTSSLVWLTACGQSSLPSSDEPLRRVSQKEFKQVLKENPSVVLVDVRTSNEYAQGKIGEAMNIDFLASDFESKISTLDKSKLTLIYCQAGGRSNKALQKMKSLGFEHVLELEGGYSRWK